MIKKAAILPFISILLLVFPVEYAVSQDRAVTAPLTRPAPGYTRLQNGLRLYQNGQWSEAVVELRRARTEAVDSELKAEALYWIALSELSAGDYTAVVRDLDELERTAPGSPRLVEIPYHKGRALFYLGRYDEAILLLKYYSDGIGGVGPLPPGSEAASRKAAALYWIGETLYAMGQLDIAQDFFGAVINEYPRSAKFEAASYRLALINQKKIEEELLYLLKWSHEESIKSIEEYQRRERSYDQALIAYQKRIADMLKETRQEDLEASNAQYRQQLSEAEARIAYLESQISSSSYNQSSNQPPDQSPALPLTESEKNERILSARKSATELGEELSRLLMDINTSESRGSTR